MNAVRPRRYWAEDEVYCGKCGEVIEECFAWCPYCGNEIDWSEVVDDREYDYPFPEPWEKEADHAVAD